MAVGAQTRLSDGVAPGLMQCLERPVTCASAAIKPLPQPTVSSVYL